MTLPNMKFLDHKMKKTYFGAEHIPSLNVLCVELVESAVQIHKRGYMGGAWGT